MILSLSCDDNLSYYDKGRVRSRDWKKPELFEVFRKRIG